MALGLHRASALSPLDFETKRRSLCAGSHVREWALRSHAERGVLGAKVDSGGGGGFPPPPAPCPPAPVLPRPKVTLPPYTASLPPFSVAGRTTSAFPPRPGGWGVRSAAGGRARVGGSQRRFRSGPGGEADGVN